MSEPRILSSSPSMVKREGDDSGEGEKEEDCHDLERGKKDNLKKNDKEKKQKQKRYEIMPCEIRIPRLKLF